MIHDSNKTTETSVLSALRSGIRRLVNNLKENLAPRSLRSLR